jgi:apolipoprotein N-acyltransferase
VGALGFAPFFVFPLYLGGLYILSLDFVASPSPRAFALRALCFYMGLFSASLHWVTHAFSVVGLGVYGPLGVIGLSGGLALIHAVGLTVFYITPTHSKAARVCVFIAAASVAEYVRGHIFTGFPWNLSCHIWPWMPLMQSAAWLGSYGLSLVTLMLIALAHRIPFTLKTSVFAFFVFVGSWPFFTKPTFAPQGEPTRIRLVQPSIPQGEKWNQHKFWNNLEKLRELSVMPAEHPIHFTIWPEAAVPTDLGALPPVREFIAAGKRPESALILGAMHTEGPAIFTSLYMLDAAGATRHVYDKNHLTPFGEYMPLRGFLPFHKLTVGARDYSPGLKREPMSLPPYPAFVPLICYEIIFPGENLPPNTNAQWIVNITNDAWFGNCVGPYQHLHIVRFRAIEQGMPVVRAANNGVSCIIDAQGRIVSQLELNHVGIMDDVLPPALTNPTLYSLWGDTLYVGLVSLLLLIAFALEIAHPKRVRRRL